MKANGKLSMQIIRKVVFVSIIIISILTIGVMAARSEVNYIDIIFPDNSQITVMTSNVQVSDILEENHILILPDEEVYPTKESNIDSSKKITISKITDEKVVISEEVSNVSTEEILGKYVKITEKILTERVEIPYETVTKDVSTVGTETTDKILQQGRNGIKEIKYKVRYQDEQEIERTIVSEEIIKKPVDKIIQISTKIISRSGSRANGSASSIAASVEGRTPTVVTLNASAYTASTCGKSPSHPGYGRTASGAMATSWYTVAAGKGVPMGTVIYIPSFADKPNGGWFVVQDRGGAISNSRIDIYMDTLSECKQFGRRNIECHIYY